MTTIVVRVRAGGEVQGLAGTVVGLLSDGHAVELRPEGLDRSGAWRTIHQAARRARGKARSRGLVLRRPVLTDRPSLIVDAEAAQPNRDPLSPPRAATGVTTPGSVESGGTEAATRPGEISSAAVPVAASGNLLVPTAAGGLRRIVEPGRLSVIRADRGGWRIIDRLATEQSPQRYPTATKAREAAEQLLVGAKS